MTSPAETPEHDFARGCDQPAASGAQELSPEQLRAKVAALAEQVRQLGNGSHPAGAVASNRDSCATERPAGAAEEFACQSGRLLEAVIETAELAAAEIRAGAEREAAEIRQRAAAAIGAADAALERHGEALAVLSEETERIERAVAALREQARTLEAERVQIDAALDLLRRRRAAP